MPVLQYQQRDKSKPAEMMVRMWILLLWKPSKDNTLKYHYSMPLSIPNFKLTQFFLIEFPVFTLPLLYPGAASNYKGQRKIIGVGGKKIEHGCLRSKEIHEERPALLKLQNFSVRGWDYGHKKQNSSHLRRKIIRHKHNWQQNMKRYTKLFSVNRSIKINLLQ